MAVLTLVQAGMAQMDDFDSSTLGSAWSVTNGDTTRYSLTERPGFLRLRPGTPDLHIVRSIPADTYLVEIHLDYAPATDSEQGGVVAYLADQHRLRLVSFYDPARPGPWTQLRLYCSGARYEGYASPDGAVWQHIGGETIAGLDRIGLVLESAAPGSTMDVDSWTVCRDRYLMVSNLPPGMKVELLDAAGYTIQTEFVADGADRVQFDFIELPLRFIGGLRCTDSAGYVYTLPATTLSAGDRYWYDVALELQMNGAALPPDDLTALGGLQNGYREVPLDLINRDTETVTNLVIGVEQYQESKGYEWVTIAEDNLGVPGAYGDRITVPVLVPGSQIRFWARIDRKSIPLIEAFNDYTFRLVIRN